MNEPSPHISSQPITTYKPSEIIGIFRSFLARQAVNAKVVYLRGVYLASGIQSYGGYFYDKLKDEDRQEEITIRLTFQQRENMENGNLVIVGGILTRDVNHQGVIKMSLNVSRIDIIQDQAVDENEIKRMELRQIKSTAGFKNVDAILEQLLYIGERPKVALLFARSSITMSDFEAGINAAKVAIDFTERRVNFSDSKDLVNTLNDIDNQCYSALAIVRGGGGGIEKLDDLSVLDAIANLKTPVIAAIGHVEEKLFIKQLVDKAAPTPNGLGQYFSEMVEKVSEKKSKSRAAITEQIKKQFKEQLEATRKQNKELQEKLTLLTKNQKEATKKHNEQVQELTKVHQESAKKNFEQVQIAQKQNQELQKKLSDITKVNTEAMSRLQRQMKEQSEAHGRAQKEFADSLKKMQDTNGELNKSLSKLTAQNAQAAKDLNEAKEKQRELEKQLQDAIKGNGSAWKNIAIGCIVFIVLAAIVLLLAL